MNDVRKGSVEPSRVAHLFDPIIVDASRSAEEIARTDHRELGEDAKLSRGGLHETQGVNLLEGEGKLKAELVDALGALNQRDLHVMNHLMQNRMDRGLRLMTYMFIPILLIEAFFTWKNAASIQRLKRAAKAYERYQQAIDKKMQELIDENFVKMALSDVGKRKLESASIGALEKGMITELRRYRVPKEGSAEEQNQQREEILARIFSGEEGLAKARRRLLDRTGHVYIDKQIRASNGVKLVAKLDAASDYYQNQARFSPLLKTRLAKGDGKDQEKFNQAWKDFGTKVQKQSETVIESGMEIVGNNVGSIADNLASTIKDSSSLFAKSTAGASQTA